MLAAGRQWCFSCSMKAGTTTKFSIVSARIRQRYVASITRAPACEKVIGTTDWGFVRLREERYTDAGLRKWIAKLNAQEWEGAFVFFKHEDVGAGPKLAARFLELAAE